MNHKDSVISLFLCSLGHQLAKFQRNNQWTICPYGYTNHQQQHKKKMYRSIPEVRSQRGHNHTTS